MPVANLPWGAIVTGLLAAIHDVMRAGKISQQTHGISVYRIGQRLSLEDADDRHVKVMDAGIKSQSVVGSIFVLVVVNMGVARVPPQVGQIGPAAQVNHRVGRRSHAHTNGTLVWLVLSAALNEHGRETAGHFHQEFTIGIEARQARADLANRLGGECWSSTFVEYVHLGGQGLLCQVVDEMTMKKRHCCLPNTGNHTPRRSFASGDLPCVMSRQTSGLSYKALFDRSTRQRRNDREDVVGSLHIGAHPMKGVWIHKFHPRHMAGCFC